MDWVKIFLVIALIVQEVQIILIQKDCDEMLNFLAAFLSSDKAGKSIKVIIEDDDDDESTGE